MSSGNSDFVGRRPLDQATEASSTKREKQHTRRRGLGRIYSRPNSPHLWIEYWHGGRQHRESCGSHLESVALRLLRKRQGEIARRGRVVGPEIERTTYAECEALLLTDIEGNRRPSYLQSAKRRVAHLRGAFKNELARDITFDKLNRYKAARLKEAAPATVRLELVLMGRMLRLAVMAGRLEHVPPIPRVTVNNARMGFASPEEVTRLLEHLPEHVSPVVRMLYLTGMRKSEAVNLEWSRLDWDAQAIRLRADDTKTGRARVVPFGSFPALADLLREQRAAVSALERTHGRIEVQVFPGCSPETFKRWWRRGTKAAGLPSLTPHDLRRSCVRNLVRAGVSEGVTMALIGHRTRAMLDRYNITSVADLSDGMAKLGSFLEPTRTQSRTQENRTLGDRS
jgi:integrase